MEKLRFVLFISFIILSLNCKSQSCEMFEIKDINTYLYPKNFGKNISKLNDSLSYSIEKLSNSNYLVQKILFGKSVLEHVYKYNGEKRYQIFKMRIRNIEKVKIANQRKLICKLDY